MSLHSLKLTILPDAWRIFSLRKTDPAFNEFKNRVFTRDNYTCQYCGFQAKTHQEVVNLDLNYHNNKLNNLATACCFCAQCFFLETVGNDDYGGGILIYMPELTQGDLNGICHVLFCAMNSTSAYSADAQAIYRNLKLRAQIVEKQLGEGMSDPLLLSRVIVDLPHEKKASIADQVLNSLRLLPSYTKFTAQIDDWTKTAFDEMKVLQETK
jgi:intracellular multiplication protein IcmJ